MPRARRDIRQEGRADHAPAAEAVIDALPALLRQAEESGAVALARFLGQALSEAEAIVQRSYLPHRDDSEMAD